MFTLQHLIDSFLTHLRLLVAAKVSKPATLRWYSDQLHQLHQLAEFPAEALRLHHLATVTLSNGFTRALKRLYRWASEEEMVPRDPFKKLAVPPCGRRERVLTRAELCALYRAALRPFRLLLYVQLHTLARPGEIRQLTWGQVDWSARCILIVDFKAKNRRKDKLKVRAIPLPLPVVRLLRNLHRKAADTSPDARVFIAPRGKPWTPNGVRCAMRRARERAGLDVGDEPVVCYHLRHTSATEAIRVEGNLKLVAEIMGHARTSTTERYLHLDTSDLVRGIDRISTRPRRATAPAG